MVKNNSDNLIPKEKLDLFGCGLDLKLKLNDGAEVTLPVGLICAPPDVAALGCSFSRELAAQYGKIIGDDAIKNGEVYGGVIDAGVIRDPMEQGSEKMLSEDPYQSSELLKYIISGSDVKLLAGGMLGGETNYCERFIDPRALKEIYMRPYNTVANSLGGAVIPAGCINGQLCSQSEEFIKILKSNLPKKALIINALGSVVDKFYAIKSGACFQIPKLKQDDDYVFSKLESGELNESQLDGGVVRAVAAMEEKSRRGDYVSGANDDDIATAANISFVRQLAESSIVMLKNEGILPFFKAAEFKPGAQTVPVFGDLTKDELEALGANFPALHKSIESLADADSKKENNDKAVLFIKSDGEISQGKAEQIKSVGEKYRKTVLVLLSSRPIALPHLNKVKAVFYVPSYNIYSFAALGKMLSGLISPSGRLNVTYLSNKNHYPSKKYLRAAQRGMFCYESVSCGYRYFACYRQPVLFPFGYGLSYLNFEYSKLKISLAGKEIILNFTVKNMSNRSGESVIFVFGKMLGENVLGLCERLVAFERVSFLPNEEKHMMISVKTGSLAVYDNTIDKWLIPGGKYEFCISEHSGGYIVSGEIKVNKGEKAELKISKKTVPDYFSEFDLNPIGTEVEKVMKMPLIAKDSPEKEFIKPISASTRAQYFDKVVKALNKIVMNRNDSREIIGPIKYDVTGAVESLSDYALRKLGEYVDSLTEDIVFKKKLFIFGRKRLSEKMYKEEKQTPQKLIAAKQKAQKQKELITKPPNEKKQILTREEKLAARAQIKSEKAASKQSRQQLKKDKKPTNKTK